MIIRYDWRAIRLYAKRDPKKVIMAVRTLLGEIPKSKYDPLYIPYTKDFRGDSYLLNIGEAIVNDFFYSYKEIAEYIALASFRNYAIYATTKDASLDLFHCPVGQDIINNNRLLQIRGNKILFMYEEVTQEK
jgi:hypothetical protein